MTIQIAHDTEIYQNFFSVVFRTIETNTKVQCVIFEEVDEREKLINILKRQPVLIGWNSISFDIPVLQAICSGWPVHDVWKLAQAIIDSDKTPSIVETLQQTAAPIETIDVKRLMGIDTSLKQTLINIQWPWIQELPYDPMKPIERDQVEFLLKYNDNDTLGTRELFLQIQDDIELRRWIEPRYGVNVINASQSAIANKLLEKSYTEATGIRMQRDAGTSRDFVRLKDCIGDNILFESDELKDFLTHVNKTQLNLNEEFVGNKRYREVKKFSERVKLNNVWYQLGVGGLHSEDAPGVFKSTDSHVLIDCDVTSFYPYIILNNGIKPAHIEPVFLNIFLQYVKDRVQRKIDGDALAAWALKIVINSIFGKLGAQSFWLYDPLAFYSVTLSGQLYLLDLAEKLHKAGAEVLSANTDGILCKIPHKNLPAYYDTCKQWEGRTRFELEFTEYEKYTRRDVNNYIAKTTHNKFKTKGCFDDITEQPFSSRTAARKYNMPIVQKALKAWFDQDIKPKDFMKGTHNIYDFLISHKPGKQFDVVYGDEQVQHVNRFYMSTTYPGRKLMKVDKFDPERLISITTEPVSILNDVTHTDTTGYPDLNIPFYVDETMKIINKIQPRTRKRSIL